ncbi:MAG: TonB family protein [Bryobacteraceae bacterium]
MFEHAVLENSFGNRRAFAASAGFAGQAALAAFIAIAPLIWPQVLPSPRFTMTITPPPPAPAPPEHMTAVRPRAPHSAAPIFRTDLLLPARMPAHGPVIVDQPDPGSLLDNGVPGGLGKAQGSTLLNGILGMSPEVSKPMVKPVEPKGQVEEVKRIRVSSLDPGRLIHMVQPVYPPIAKTAHIEGTVELSAVIGTDGRVRDLSVVSGHPLLRNAAIDAVRQWIYKPPVLNGESVEIVAPIAVIFRLN